MEGRLNEEAVHAPPVRRARPDGQDQDGDGVARRRRRPGRRRLLEPRGDAASKRGAADTAHTDEVHRRSVQPLLAQPALATRAAADVPSGRLVWRPFAYHRGAGPGRRRRAVLNGDRPRRLGRRHLWTRLPGNPLTLSARGRAGPRDVPACERAPRRFGGRIARPSRPSPGMDSDARAAALDDLAAALRERLSREAGGGGRATCTARIRALVDREAALLDAADARRARARVVAERSFGLGPLEPLLRDPAVDEVMVNGAGPRVGRARAGGSSATDVAFARDGELRHAIERILAPLGPPRRRGRAAVRRAAAGRLARERRDPAAGARRAGADDPPLPPARLRRRRPRRARARWTAAAARLPRARACARALNDPRQRRHRLGQDDDAQRAVGVRPRRRADRDDRGRRRAAPAPAARRPPGGAAAERRGPRRGDDPPARAQRAADAARPDRRRRGPRAREALDMLSAMTHRPRRLAVDRPRRLAGGGAAAGRDARADGRRRAAARGDPRAGRRRDRPRRPPGARAPTARGASSRSPRSCASPAGPATRELYALARRPAGAGAPPLQRRRSRARLAEAA